MKSIAAGAFYYCELRSTLTIPKGVKTISADAFSCSSLKGIVIPDSVTRIEGGAFRFYNLRKIVIPDSVTKIGEGAFYCCYRLRSVKKIDSWMFDDCSRRLVIHGKKGSYAETFYGICN